MSPAVASAPPRAESVPRTRLCERRPVSSRTTQGRVQWQLVWDLMRQGDRRRSRLFYPNHRESIVHDAVGAVGAVRAPAGRRGARRGLYRAALLHGGQAEARAEA